MRRLTVATVSVAASLALAACAERDTTSPRSVAASRASYTLTPSGTCDFGAIQQAGQAYFAVYGNDPVKDLVKSMKDAYNTAGGGAVAATPFGWNVLKRVADARLTSATNGGADGRVFVIDVLRCMADLSSASTPKPALPFDTALTNHLEAVLNSGLFEVRGQGASPDPAFGKVKSGGTRTFGSPRWGVEKANQTTPATAWPDLTYLVYGYPTQIGSPVLGDPGAINANDDLGGTYNGFDLGTVPFKSSHPGLLVGMCVTSNPAGAGSIEWLVHNNAEVLVNNSPTQLCSGTYTASARIAPAWYAQATGRALSLLAPKQLFAQGGFDSRCDDCIGGLPSGWSPFGKGLITATGAVVTFNTQPGNTTEFTDITVQIKVTQNGIKLPGQTINSIGVLNNQGAPAGAIIVQDNLPVTTNSDGIATVVFQVGKPGSYYVTIGGIIDGATFGPATSKKFNVKNQ